VSVALLDVNILVALLDPSHFNHEDAHEWFGANRKQGWATCPLTINGCARVLSQPEFPGFRATVSDALNRLREACARPDHEHWPDEVSLLDESLFRPAIITGPRMITDAYLLGLAVRRSGRLATFDRSIPLKAVVGATPAHVVLLGGAATRGR
jgi:uncharacterized protein